MSSDRREAASGEPTIDRFLGEPTRDPADWRWLWGGNVELPLPRRRGLVGRLKSGFKRLLRRFVVAPQADLWERQRLFNLILLEYHGLTEAHGGWITEHESRLRLHEERFSEWRDGMAEVMEHNDALFARADQKLDRIRRETRELWSGLGAALAAAERNDTAGMVAARKETDYVDFEHRFRGTAEEIAGRIEPYVERLRGRGEVLDLGCGRGEALAVLRAAGIPARGVDDSEAMVEACRGAGLSAERADLFAALENAPPGSLGAVVSFHVIEHLPATSLDRLVRLAWRALAPGGALLLETPNPASLVVAARNFWIDPTHTRPVHPATLEHLCRAAGFDEIERIDLRPFPADARLAEIDLAAVPEDLRPLAHRINEVRDQLDDLLFGCQDYALLATRSA